MQFNVSELLRESYGAFREYAIDDDVSIDGASRRVTGHVRFDRVPEGVFVRATVRGAQPSECSRCLDPFTLPVDLLIEEQYVPTIDPLTSVRVTPPEGEEDAYRIDERHMVDLTLPIMQYWTMALPIAPVCDDQCQGMCETCGERRTSGHACAGEPDDGRWARLRDLKLG